MSFMEDVALLNELTGFAGELASKPRAMPNEDWQEQCEFLDGKLTAAIPHSAYRSQMGNFAPLLITSIRRTLAARRFGDERLAEKWECLLGHLTPLVRADTVAILARAKELGAP